MSNYNHHFVLGSIGKVTPHGVRKSYHRDGTIPSTIDIGSLRVGAESQVVIIIALTISWIVVRLKIKHVNPVQILLLKPKSWYLDFSNKKSEYLDFSSDMPGYGYVRVIWFDFCFYYCCCCCFFSTVAVTLNVDRYSGFDIMCSKYKLLNIFILFSSVANTVANTYDVRRQW